MLKRNAADAIRQALQAVYRLSFNNYECLELKTLNFLDISKTYFKIGLTRHLPLTVQIKAR